jgi:hypothetical protein
MNNRYWLFAVFLTALLLSGCWSMSIPSDQPEEFNTRKKVIKPLLGSTSEEVTKIFGPPIWIALEDNATYYIYEWRSKELAMMWILYFPTPIFVNEQSGDVYELHCILLKFGSDDILKSYKIDSEGATFVGEFYLNCPEVFGLQKSAVRPVEIRKHAEDRSEEIRKHAEDRSEETRKLAEEGDAKAMYHVYRGMRNDHIEPVSAWEWLCKGADLGYENAQIEVAYWHRESNWEYARPNRIEWLRKAKIRADDRIAYLWYTLAAKGDDKRLRIRDNLFSETLSEKEIAEAKDMVSNWKPGQCQSGLMKVTSE